MDVNHSRRRLLATAGALVAGSTVVSATQSASPSADGNWEPADVQTTTSDGTITDVYVEPTVEYSWEQFAEPPTEVGFRLVTDSDGNGIGEVIDDRTVELESAATSGSKSYTYPERVSLAREGPWDTEQFEAPTDGETTTKTIPLLLHVFVYGPNATALTTLSGSFTVSVTNADETASANGTANTGIES